LRDTELICLDLDGCLVDSTEAITTGIATALGMFGLPAPPPSELRWCVGPPLRESIGTLFATLGGDPARVGDCMEAYRELYAATWFPLTRVFDGIPEALDGLVSDGRRLAIVTSKPKPISAPIIDGLGLRLYFEALHAPDSDHGSEPKTQTLTRALAALLPAGESSRAVMVGDRFHDVAAGQACGTGTVGVTWGAGDRTELETAGADHVVDTPSQLAGLFD
jgi:phosphoglycolate phosphatase